MFYVDLREDAKRLDSKKAAASNLTNERDAKFINAVEDKNYSALSGKGDAPVRGNSRANNFGFRDK